MATLSDVQALYSSVRNTWTKSQAHVVAHVLLALIIFVFCKATLPPLTVPMPDPKVIADSEWFKLAKETGFVYAAFVVPIIAITVYVAVLRFAGRLLVALVLVIFQPSGRKKPVHLLTAANLEPLAITLKRDDFEFGDLVNRSGEFALKYQSRKTDAWQTYQKSIEALTKNAQVYLGDFLVFALLWIIVFQLPSRPAWTQANQSHFWSVLLALLAFAWFAWFRVSRAVAAVPTLLLIYVSMMLRTDPDVAPLLESNEEERRRLRQRLEAVLEKEKETAASQPALRRFVSNRLGLREPGANYKSARDVRGLPFPAVYRRGSRFARDPKQYEQYDKQWLRGYLAYLYYRLHRRLSNLTRSFGQLIRYVVTGAP